MAIKYDGGHWFSEQSPEELKAILENEVEHLSAEERLALEAILKELMTSGESDALNDAIDLEYEIPPVDPLTFLDDDYFFGVIGRDMRPKLRDDFVSLFNGDYVESILCLHPDTSIPLLDGTTPTIAAMAEAWKEKQEPFWLYSVVDGQVVSRKAINPHQTGVDDYYKVTLDDGTSFTGNSRHQMIMRDGSKRMIKDMEIGDSLMPFESDIRLVSRIECAGRGPVFCMTVPEAGNFAIATVGKEVEEFNSSRRSGVFSSNTGAIGWG